MNTLNTNKEDNMSFSDYTIQKVWEKGQKVTGNAPNVWRKDQCGAWIGKSFYGDRRSKYGWEIDHIKPASQGGGDDLYNLRPLQWENNANKQDERLTCPVTAVGINNSN